MSRPFCLALAATAVLAGCNQIDKKDAQVDDPSNPYYKLAQSELDAGNPAKAADDYEAALAANPNLAGAHYQLGHIYGDKLNDPIGEIFHFEQYVKLSPSGDKIDEVKALIDKQSQAFAASLPNSPAQNADDYARLQADNVTLKKEVDDAAHTITQLQTALTKSQADTAQLQAQVASLQAAVKPVTNNSTTIQIPSPNTTTTNLIINPTPNITFAGSGSPPATSGPVTPGPTAPAPSTDTTPHVPPKALPLDATNVVLTPVQPAPGTPATAPAPDATAPARSYTVVKGDKLWTIARKMYPGGNTKDNVEKIQDANQQVLGNKPLKIGQVLVIP